MFAAACKLGLEGIVSKKLDAPYRSGPSKNLDQSKKSEGASDAARRTGRSETAGGPVINNETESCGGFAIPHTDCKID